MSGIPQTPGRDAFMIQEGTISGKIAKDVLEEMYRTGNIQSIL